MATCFVIQPFDGGGKFDKRYHDIFEPAIRDTGLEAYRVDNDPAVTIPIDDIENGIRRASVCLADITLDNPNVWFELGYALATEKQICLVCSEERTGKYPFDVQHRAITKYRLESKADFASLQSTITQRVKALMDKSATLAIIEHHSPLKEPNGLLQHEMIVLASILENREGPGSGVSHWTLKQELERLGYNNLALNIGLEGLVDKGMISVREDSDYNGNSFNLYFMQPQGMQWIVQNYERLNLRFGPQPAKQPKKKLLDLDDDIPF